MIPPLALRNESNAREGQDCCENFNRFWHEGTVVVGERVKIVVGARSCGLK